MGIRTGRINGAALLVVMLVVLAAACSGSEPTDPVGAASNEDSPTSSPATPEEWCAAGAERIVERFEAFLGGLPDVSPEDFLELDEIEGLVPFQNDVAQIISETTSQNSTLCDLDGLQQLVATELQSVERDGLLAEYLVTIIQDGRELTTQDLAVEPGDDVEAVLSLLDDDSTLTFAPGTYVVDRPLIVQRSVSFLGSGIGDTTIASTASDAAIVVAGRGELIMRDMRVEHTGDAPASVVLAFDRPVDLANVELTGGVADAEGGAGNGLVLADEPLGAAPAEPSVDDPDAADGTDATTETDGADEIDAASQADESTGNATRRSVIADSVLNDNAGAGLAVTGDLSPRIERSEMRRNGICGVCWFGAASGELVEATLSDNDYGVQVADTSSPRITASTISQNTTAGIVVIGTATPTIEGNRIEANGEIGLAAQEDGGAIATDNSIVSNPVGISVLSTGQVRISGGAIEGGEVALQIAEGAAPRIAGTQISDPSAIGIAVAGDAEALLDDIDITLDDDGVGLAAEQTAYVEGERLTVDGGAVAVAVAGSAETLFADGTFTGQEIGVQIDEMAVAWFEEVDIVEPETAGVVARGSSELDAQRVRIADSGEVGFVLADTAQVQLVEVEVRGGLSGVSIVGSASVVVSASQFEDLEVGIQIADEAAPELVGNDFVEMRSAGLVFVGDAAGTAEANRIQRPGIVGIQLGESARPALIANVLLAAQPTENVAAEGGAEADAEAGDGEVDSDEGAEGLAEIGEDEVEGNEEGGVAGEPDAEPGADDLVAPDLESADGLDATVGILYAGDTAGSADANQMVGFVIGIQVGESATPMLVDNVIDGGLPVGVGILYRDGGGGVATGNETSRHAVGFQVGDDAAPTLEDNRVVTARNVAFLIQGAAAPVLDRNICPEGLAGIGLLDGVDPEREANDCLVVRSE